MKLLEDLAEKNIFDAAYNKIVNKNKIKLEKLDIIKTTQ